MQEAGKTYWRSLDEREQTPEFRAFLDKEFPNFSSGLIPEATRRQFLRVMGASLALAGLTGCRWPKEHILPFAQRPENTIPGQPRFYATALDIGGYARPLVITSIDGRPLKVEGNELHPESNGATDAISQASILGLYDPDRSQRPARRAAPATGAESHGAKAQASHADSSWATFQTEVIAAIRASGPGRVAVLAEASSSLTRAALRDRLVKTGASWYEYEPVSRDNERGGLNLAFGKTYRLHTDLSRAQVLVDFDADLLGSHPGAVANARRWVDGRRGFNALTLEPVLPVENSMNRLYCVESLFTITGGMADRRLPLPPGAVTGVLVLLGKSLSDLGLGLSADLTAFVKGATEMTGHPRQEIVEIATSMARDLLAKRGAGVIAVGPTQPPIAHALAAAYNQALGNAAAGGPIHYTLEPDTARPSHGAAIADLAGKLEAGQVDTLLIIGGNPVYDAPADLDFGSKMARAKTTIHLSAALDETSSLSMWHLPRSHYLEAWGDAVSYDGNLTIVQPLIAPLYDTRSDLEVLSLFADAKPAVGYDLVRTTMMELHQPGSSNGAPSAGFEKEWRSCLNDGLVRKGGAAQGLWAAEYPAIELAVWGSYLEAYRTWSRRVGTQSENVNEINLLLPADAKVLDGRFANNGWLQELPAPLTKLTWDNAAMISPGTAERLNFKTEDRLRIKVMVAGKAAEVVAPAYILPGLADAVVVLSLGYGRKFGRVAKGAGVNAYPLRTSTDSYLVQRAVVERAGGTYQLASTQSHHTISSLHVPDKVGDAGYKARIGEIYREAQLDEFVRNPEFARKHQEPTDSLWIEPLSETDPIYRWGMSIDLNACTGCSACVVACVAENNIPVVGKDEVSRGREMHWLRVDRYFEGTVENPTVGSQPIPCQQCENAPCESVCPVAATTHSDEGLNDMVYNRCIGTRYCSNNCPYKVRRFNYWNNHQNESDVDKMKWNPNVTVRGRGVMEKCTYCVQRISRAKIESKNKGERVADGAITPACAQVCPTGAITFGDLNDKQSRVLRLHRSQRSYAMLNELNVKPRTRYLAKLRNAGIQVQADPK